ncbi:helix-turn-helix domain-containing protein [Flagellimonas meridianipacifica]|uniref:AraC-like DNA-binding protein n=1 Tax=Flagellimonas meridianipacifica TaxID=1080225 RepID=A0A2T0M978_9FLAO|nr:helix-turn-helix domain-containing protein [Allomuricauda pacifica]PRX54030.1 AraC-like DNA-binding protein [Allomuricauda pacifica]
MGRPITIFVLSLSVFFGYANHTPFKEKTLASSIASYQDSIKWADYFYNIQRYNKAIPLYQKNLENPNIPKTRILKRLALSQAGMGNSFKSTENLNKYLQLEFNPNFLLNEGFDPIRETSEFKRIEERVIPKVTTWSVIYLFVAIIGFYVVLLISLNQQIHPVSRILIGSFIFIHSFFILHISINAANYFFEYAHTYLMSTWGTFLYGPLLYFYIKRTSQKYAFKLSDLLHLAPTIILLAYLITEVYTMSAQSKIVLMLSRMQNGLGPQDSNRLFVLVVLKITSLTLYGLFIARAYNKGKKEKLLDSKSLKWQKNLSIIHIVYVLTYTAYGIVIVNGYSNGWLYDVSTASMALMVLYVGYSANIQPDVFNGIYSYNTNKLFPKYEKSGLTPSLSLELRESLVHLFAVERIYKENTINLDMVADRLNTTRHNASQVINEHFNVSFHEFVNMYRIKEAKELLTSEDKKLNIIHVAYEVGYNNKVTFNKAFKKDTNLTPTQYLKTVAESAS